ncbi:MAG TPA: outer membrane beta-barrel protein [Polyangiaceae bacterium]
MHAPMRIPSRSTLCGAILAVAVGSYDGAAWAGGGAATDSYEDIRDHTFVDLHALADVYVQHEEPTGGSLQLRAFDVRSDQPALNLLRVTVAHRPDWFGFRVDAGVGDMPDAFLRYDPAATAHPGLSRGLSYLEQAFVTVAAPAGRGVSIDVGKFGTPVGLEDNETPSNWNYSRSLLFTVGEPTYHTGVRATGRVTEDLAFSAFWLNGWNTNVLAGNGMRSFASAATWEARHVDLELVYAGGLERAPTHLVDPTLTFRHELDASAVFALRSWLGFAATADYGRDARSGGVSWWGVGGFARCRILPWLAAVVRGEHYADPEAFTTGTAQRIAEGTVTTEATTHVGPVTVIGRLEYRRDQSDEPVFRAAGQRTLTHQDSSTLGLMAAF